MNRLREKYQNDVLPALKKEFGYTNVMAIPRITKVVVNMGLGEATQNAKIIDTAADELGKITGQKAAVRRAKKSIAAFKVREGMETGLKVTLRGNRMWEFLDRMIALAFPRVKDFRGLPPEGFDNHGNFNFGFTEQTVFPEVDAAAVNFQQGMNITLVTTARRTDEGRELLKQFGFPFRSDEKQ